MQLSLAKFIALASQALVGADYEAHIQATLEARPLETEKIRNVALLNTDYVIHYEKAVILGTTAEYEEQTKIWHFDQMLKAVDTQCAPEIDMATCVRELVCEKKFPHNFSLEIMICD